MMVLVPSALQSYTGRNWVQSDGETVAEVLNDLDHRYPGIRFRMIDEQGNIRRHMRLFSDGAMINTLSHTLRPESELLIVQALSGG